MIAILKHGTTPSQTSHLVDWLKTMNLDVHISQGWLLYTTPTPRARQKARMPAGG